MGPRGVTSVKIRVAIGVPARGAVGVEGRESGSCGGLMWLRFWLVRVVSFVSHGLVS